MQKSLLFRNRLLLYEVRGKGAPVMLVHGFTEDRRIWDPFLEGLNEKYQWMIPDLPGSGQSDYNETLHHIKDFADALKAIAEQENCAAFVLIGHSMGGYISLAFAEKYPQMIRGLGLFHSTSYADPVEKKETREKNIQFIHKYGSLPFVELSVPGLFSESFNVEYQGEIVKLVTRYANFKPESLVQYLEIMKKRPETTSVLKTISKPVLFIIGEEDKAVPLKDTLEQCHLPWISYIHILTRTAHMGMIENTLLCRSMIDRFLDEIPD